MKKKLLLTSMFFLAFIAFSNAQCDTDVSGFGNNSRISEYNISSSNANPVEVEVVLNNTNSLTLNLGANFTTDEGPDVRAFLLNSEGATDIAIENTIRNSTPITFSDVLDTIEIGLVGALDGNNNPSPSVKGEKSFTITIPNDKNIEDYDKILFHCKQFNQFWDVGSFTPFSTTNCNALSLEENTLSQDINFYPNPTNKNITITNNKQINASIGIYNILGEKVLQTENNIIKEQTINLASLKSGVYLIQIQAEGKRITKKLIKE